MKLTGLQLLNIADSGIFRQFSGEKMSPVGMFRFDRIVAVVGPETVRLQNARNALITPEISSVEESGMRRVRPECVAAFEQSLASLLAEEVDLAIKPLVAEDLAGIRISRNDRLLFGPLLEDPKE